MRWLGYAWDASAWWLILSVVSAGAIQTVRKARARGKRLFVDEPTARVKALKHDTSGEHIYDA